MTSALLFVTATVITAPPSVAALFPAGCQVGQSVEVTAQGSLGEKPQGWSSREGVTLEFLQGGRLKVVVPEKAEAGICWLRFFNVEGASSLRPFVIGTLPEAIEKEPNNSASEAQKLDNSQFVVNGVLEKSGDVDTFAVPLKAGQTLVAAVTAKRTLNSPMDAVLQILSPRGFVLEHNDDDHGLDPLIAFTAPTDGEYRARLFAFPEQPNTGVNFAGGANFIYRLTLTTGPFVDHAEPMSVARGKTDKLKLHGWNLPPALAEFPIANSDGDSVDVRDVQLGNVLTLPIEPGESFVENTSGESRTPPQSLNVSSSVTGHLARPGEVDVYSLKLSAKQQVHISVVARQTFSPLDPVVRVLKSDGTQLQEQDDASRGDFDPEFNLTAATEGEYRLAITDRFGFGGPRFVYRLSVTTQQPDFSLKVAADAFVLNADKPLEIPVTIDRQRNFAQEIELSVIGLPDGVTAEPIVSKKDGDSAKSVKLTLKSEAAVPFSGVTRIVGKTKTESPVEKPALATLTGFGTTTSQIWLTVVAAEKK